MSRWIWSVAGILTIGGLGIAMLLRSDPPTPPIPQPTPASPPANVSAASETPFAAQATVHGNNEFAFDLYRQLASKPGNVFFSPLSASTALAMTASGARGETLAEMHKMLHLGDGADAGYKDLLARVNAKSRGYELKSANSLWAQKDFPWRPEFLKQVTDVFGADVLDADFSNSEAERKRINDWAEEHTAHKIKDLLAPGTVTTDERMVLVNAIYFKGAWQDKFDPKLTRKRPFTLASGKKKDIHFMNREGGFRVRWAANEDDVSVAEIPYQGDDVSFVVLLPTKHDGLPGLEKKLSAKLLDDWLRAAQPTERAYLSLPKMRLEMTMDLQAPLQALGMVRAFDKNLADFTGMFSGGNLFVSFVVQKAFVDVNEEGTEAAAATAVGMAWKSESEPQTFAADHPFVFLIRHRPTNTILFAGRYEQP